MPNRNIQVTVTFDYNNGTPIWAVPEKISVPHGEVDTITWSLVCQNLPPGVGARFARVDPIRFVTTKRNMSGPVWTGPMPSRLSDLMVSVDDDNRGPSGETKHYLYTIFVETITFGTVQVWADDPEVENVGT